MAYYGQKHPEQKLHFSSEDQLISWISDYEEKHLVKFRSRDYKNYLFYCHRSYRNPRYVTSRNIEVRNVGSRIMNTACTCQLIVTPNIHGFNVRLYSKHYGHELDKTHKQHLPLPLSDKVEITQKLASGVPLHDILKKRFMMNIRQSKR